MAGGAASPQLVTVLPLKFTMAVPPLTNKALVKPVKVLVPMVEPATLAVTLIPVPNNVSVVLAAPVKVLPLTVTSKPVEIPQPVPVRLKVEPVTVVAEEGVRPSAPVATVKVSFVMLLVPVPVAPMVKAPVVILELETVAERRRPL